MIKHRIEGLMNKDRSSKIGCDVKAVGLWRNRWYNRTLDVDITLDENGCILSDKRIMNRIKDILSDDPRSGCPPRLSEQEQLRITALAFESPQDYCLPTKRTYNSSPVLNCFKNSSDIKSFASIMCDLKV